MTTQEELKRYKYFILQLRRCDETACERFESYENLRRLHKKPNPDHYENVYTGDVRCDGDICRMLENLYELFNVDSLRPGDFAGCSLSVSDIIGIKHDNGISYYYVDSIGFKKLSDFVMGGSENV